MGSKMNSSSLFPGATQPPKSGPWTYGDYRRDNAIRYMMYEIEGKAYDDEPNDPGGPTRFGISQNYDAKFLPGNASPVDKIKNLRPDQAFKAYVSLYWNKPWPIIVDGKEINLPAAKDIPNARLAYAIFDCKVHCPQKAMADIYSIYTNKTLTPDQKADAIVAARDKYYKPPTSGIDPLKRFRDGYAERTVKTRRFLGIPGTM